MNVELQKYLVDKYPKILGRSEQNAEHCYGMFGIECNDGWFLHLDRMFDHIQSEIDFSIQNHQTLTEYYKKLPWHKKIKRKINNWKYRIPNVEEPITQVVAMQIKEKWGKLRFYYSGGNSRIDELVYCYEEYSKYICEDCGSTIDVGSTGGWVRNVCKKHDTHNCRIIHNEDANELFNKIVKQ